MDRDESRAWYIINTRLSTRANASIMAEMCPASMETFHHFQDLPQELFEWTARFLPSEDLFNLRLASKDMAAKTVKIMSERYFRELHVLMMDQASMTRLMFICLHPEFKKGVRVIKFNNAVLEDEENNYGYYELPDKWETWITNAHQQSIYDSHIQFRSMIQKCIYGVLSYFDLSGVTPEIQTTGYGLNLPPDSTIQAPWGVNRLKRELGEQRLVHRGYRRDQKAYDLLCRGIFSSSLKIQRLTLGQRCAIFDPWTLIESIAAYDRYEPFRRLTHLELHLPEQKVDTWERNIPGRVRDIDAHVCAIMWLVSQAESLESLSLCCESNNYVTEYARSCDAEFFQALAEAQLIGFEKLLMRIKHLSLEGHEIPKKMLLDFVREHSSTLRSLDLWEIIDGKRDDPGMKMDIFQAARDIPDVRLRMGRVYEGTRAAIYSDQEGWVLPQWESSEEFGRVRYSGVFENMHPSKVIRKGTAS